MKYFILTSVFSFGMSFLHAQEKEINPFESIGKQGSVTTLSNGKYTEVHVDDSLQRVGSVIINMNTGKIHAFLDRDSLYATEALDPTVFSRWYSLDPVVKPHESPYNFVANNPIYFVDPDGRDNIVYLVVIPSGNPEQDLIDAQKVADEATAMYRLMGVETTVIVFDETVNGKFNQNYIDNTDAVAYLGNPMDLNTILNNQSSTANFNGTKFDDLDLSPGPYLITLNTFVLDEYQRGLKLESKEKTAGFGIVHGSSHLANAAHIENNPDIKDKNELISYALEGEVVKVQIQKYNIEFDELFNPDNQPKTIEAHKKRFGDNKSKDNYQKNKQRIETANKIKKASEGSKNKSSDSRKAADPKK